MKSNKRWMFGLTVMVGACLGGGINSRAATTADQAAEARAMMGSYEAQQKAAAEAREKDSGWKPACAEVGSIQVGDAKRPGALKNFCLNTDGNILACFAGREGGKP